jgi:hypothetical protein
MQKGELTNVEFFKKQEYAFIADIGPVLAYRVYFDHEAVFQEGEMSEFIYFIINGHANLVYGPRVLQFRRIL